VTDYSNALELLNSKGFSLISKKDNLNNFTCQFQKKDIKILLKVQLGGYILGFEISDEKTKFSLKDKEIELILKVI